MEVTPEVVEILQDAPEIIEAVVMAPEATLGANPWMLGGLIFLLTFFIEETAIATSAYMIGKTKISFMTGFTFLYAGIYVSDLFLYGRVAIRRSRWVRKPRGYFALRTTSVPVAQ